MPDETDARSIMTASPSEDWRRPPGRPRTTWMKTIQQDLRSNNLSLDEAITVAQNRPLWRRLRLALRNPSGACHTRRRRRLRMIAANERGRHLAHRPHTPIYCHLCPGPCPSSDSWCRPCDYVGSGGGERIVW